MNFDEGSVFWGQEMTDENFARARTSGKLLVWMATIGSGLLFTTQCMASSWQC